MTQIKNLFDSSKDIYRTIDKVVTFDSLDETSLKREVSEYVVTEKLKASFQKLLDALYAGMESESHEVGIWVSGFYGSGKSSFAKNFGLALDKGFVVEGIPFRERLANRIDNLPISQQLKSIVEKYSPLVFLVNLATQQLKLYGNSLPPVSDVLHHHVMKWAGYAPEEKIALLERKLEMDGRLDDFKQNVKTDKGEDWDEVKFRDTITAKAIAQDLAPAFYPSIWKDARAFNIMRIDSIEDESQRMIAMLNLIKKKTGKENVIFIIDEVGQYISAKDDLILHMQGTMENLKNLGKGKAWLLATAQQTLTEDNPNARYNSEKLFKLNDRFPVKVDIEASDIKEITTQRLLGKSEDGAKKLKELYAKYGEQLRLNTRLANVERTIYKSELDERSFINLYPFLPYQFDILLSMLAKLARRTGGIGLRSAIRVIQDVLTEAEKGVLLAEQPIGTLATVHHIYNVLHADIRKSYPHISNSVDKVLQIKDFGENSIEAKVAKSVAVLQILDDFHLSVENLAVAMHPSVDAPGMKEEIRQKVEELKNTRGLTLKEIDGQLRFMTDAIIRIEEEKQKIFVSGADTRRIFENQIEALFTPSPSARILNTKTVKTGIQLVLDDRISKILDPNEEIQTEVHFFQRSSYDRRVNEIKSISTDKINESKLFFIGVLDEEVNELLEEIVRCEGIYATRGKYSDKEINDYLNSQFQEAQQIKQQLYKKLAVALEKGDFIFRGTSKATTQLGNSVKEAANNWLKTAAEKVYHKYNQAPVTVDSNTIKKFLQFDDLKVLPSTLNPFDAIKTDGSINIQIPAIQSIKDYLQAEGQAEGRKILEDFQGAPYGWHRDSTRYLLAVMFIASEIKLRIAGDWVKVKGPSAIEKFTSNTHFYQVGISLYSEDQPTLQQKKQAALNLTELTGVQVLPLPQKISEVVMKYFPEFQRKYADLKFRLETLQLPGVEKAEAIQEGIAEILKGDASDATFRLGKENAELYLALIWAKKVYGAIENGIEKTIRQLNTHKEGISDLPNHGITGELKKQMESKFEVLNRILRSENFFEKTPELKDNLLEIDNIINNSCEAFRVQENQKIQEEVKKLKSSLNWNRLNEEQKGEFSSRLENILIQEKQGIEGIRGIINEAYSFNTLMKDIEAEIEDILTVEDDPDNSDVKKIKKVSFSHLPKKIERREDIDIIIAEFQKLKEQLSEGEIIDLNW